VTKSSEVPDAPVQVRLHDGSQLQGEVKIRRPELDLALIKIDRGNLQAIQWNIESNVPLGGWIASADARAIPLAMGVVSVKSRTIPKSDAKLGIKLLTLGAQPQVENVVFGSGADRAGIREGDIILRIEDKPMESGQQVLSTLMGMPAGKRIQVDVERDGKELAFQAQMMDLTLALLDPTEMEVNGSVSARSTGFRNVIQHDTVLAPQHCGGPLIDVEGNVVGLNIARAGRVCCYALPANTVAKAVGEMLATAMENATSTIRVETLKPEFTPN
jgi:serine protease Do